MHVSSYNLVDNTWGAQGVMAQAMAYFNESYWYDLCVEHFHLIKKTNHLQRCYGKYLSFQLHNVAAKLLKTDLVDNFRTGTNFI